MPNKNDEPTDTDATPQDAQTPGGEARQDEAGLGPDERRGLPGLGMTTADETAPDREPEAQPQASDGNSSLHGDGGAGAEGAPADPAHGLVAAEAREEEALEEERHTDHSADHGHDPHHDDEGGSFASRALWTLVLLLVGIGLGLWAAPRLVPLLPAGLAPVAVWLSPAEDDSAAQLAELEARLSASDARIGELVERAEAGPGAEALVSQVSARLESEIAELRALVAENAAAGEGAGATENDAALRQRIDRLEAATQGQSAEVQNLVEQLSNANLASQQSEEAAAQVDVNRAELEGLRAEVATLSDDVSALSSRIDEVAANAEQRVAEAETRANEAETRAAESEEQASAARDQAATQTALAQIRAALTSGAGFSDALYSLGTVPGGLSAIAASGAVPMPQLRDRFPEAAHRAIRAAAAATAEDEDLATRVQAFIGAQFASRSLEPQTGDSPDAILSRMEEALARGDLEAALDLAEALPPVASEAMGDWLRDAERRAEAVEALDILTADLSATN